TRVLTDSKVVGNGGRGDTTEGDNLSAIHVVAGADGFKDAEPGLVRERLGNAFNLLAIHDPTSVTNGGL
ncbi:MAG: hypothetical protein WBR26_17810, partial [Candidatus Acidiferrum sp.]